MADQQPQQLIPGETHPSGLQDEQECPSDHDEVYAVKNPCTYCGAQK